MQKFVRSVVLVTTLSLSLAPAVTAETMGSNPRPRQQVQTRSILETLKSIFFAYMGM